MGVIPNLRARVISLASSLTIQNLQLGKTFVLEWNYKSEYILFFFVFGYFGWGTTDGLNTFFSVSNLFTIIVLGFSFVVIFRRRVQNIHHICVHINLGMILAFFGFLALGITVNLQILTNSLTLDEVAYGWASQLQSYVIALKLSSYMPEFLLDFDSRIVLQLIALTILGFIVFAVRVLLKLKSNILFVVVIFIATFIFRLIVQFLGGANSPNSPLSSLWYFTTSSLFGINNFTFRISTSVLFAALATYISYSYVKINRNPLFAGILVGFLIYSTPLLNVMSVSVEIATWTFFVTVMVFLKLAANNFTFTNNMLLLMAVGYYLRVNIIILLISCILSILLSKRSSSKAEFSRLFHYVILILPGLVPVFTGRFMNKIGNEGFSVDDVVTNLGNTYTAIEQSGSRLYLYIGMTMMAIILLKQKSRLFLAVWFFLNILFFIALNSSGLTLQSKYVIEYLFPLVVTVGAWVSFKQNSFGTLLKKTFIAALMLVNIAGVFTSDRVLDNFRNTYDPMHGAVGETYSSLPFLPLPYRETFSYLKDRNINGCFNSGIVYSSFPEVLEGLSLAEVSKQRDVRSNFLAVQSKIGESWSTLSSESLRLAQIDCVILGSIDSQGFISDKLSGEGWTLIARFRDPKYGTSVDVLKLLS
jgi:hypothetical protein